MLIAFPLQQRASMLRYTYIGCLILLMSEEVKSSVKSSEGQIPSYDIYCVKACWSSSVFEGEGHVRCNLPKRREVLVQRHNVTNWKTGSDQTSHICLQMVQGGLLLALQELRSEHSRRTVIFLLTLNLLAPATVGARINP